MLLLKIVRPRTVPTRKDQWGRGVRFYCWVLERLMAIYRRGAISDTVNVGGARVVHNVRDYWFEEELRRLHIKTDRHMTAQSTPFAVRRRYRRSRLFDWSETMVVYSGGRSYTIKRGGPFSIDTDMEGTLKAASSDNLVIGTEYTARAVKTEPEESRKPQPDARPETPHGDDRSRFGHKIKIGDTVPPKASQEPKETPTTKFKGFEENDIF